MEDQIDFTTHTEAELVEMFGRMDPRYAPTDCARLGKLLAERGYVVTPGETGPGQAVPSPEKLRTLIGSPQPVSFNVEFGHGGGSDPMHNELQFAGSGALTLDGISVWISGQRQPRGLASLFPSLSKRDVEVPYRSIVNVESSGHAVRFEYRGGDLDPGAISLRLADEAAAQRLVAMLPKTRTAAFDPQIKINEEFTRRLLAQSPRTPVTFVIIGINAVVFVATLVNGAGWFTPSVVQLAWGSNFGPYTTDGDWWRLVTSMFIHFGIIHLASNMLALAVFGPLVERLFGSMNYVFIYVFAGIIGSMTSVAWHPEINSAGASGAIFGVLGALLASLLVAQVRRENRVPPDILRPIAKWALLFLVWNLYQGFRSKGIDYADHIGGLSAGFLLGLVAARPVTGERSYSLGDLRRLAQMVPVGIALLAGGAWWAQTAAATLTGDSLYMRTLHSIRSGEHAANRKFDAALALAKSKKLTQRAFADEISRDILPYWRQASSKLAAIELPANSPNRANLETLQQVATRRVRAYELLSEALRDDDAQEMTWAQYEIKRANELARRMKVGG